MLQFYTTLSYLNLRLSKPLSKASSLQSIGASHRRVLLFEPHSHMVWTASSVTYVLFISQVLLMTLTVMHFITPVPSRPFRAKAKISTYGMNNDPRLSTKVLRFLKY
jgi:hypothetical protein